MEGRIRKKREERKKRWPNIYPDITPEYNFKAIYRQTTSIIFVPTIEVYRS